MRTIDYKKLLERDRENKALLIAEQCKIIGIANNTMKEIESGFVTQRSKKKLLKYFKCKTMEELTKKGE